MREDVLHHASITTGTRTCGWGDDFTILGYEESLDSFKERITDKYEIKFRGRLGPNPKDDKEIRLLNRVIYWGKEGIKYEPDQRHAEIMIKLAGVEGKKSVVTPGSKPTDTKDEEEDDRRLKNTLLLHVARKP